MTDNPVSTFKAKWPISPPPPLAFPCIILCPLISSDSCSCAISFLCPCASAPLLQIKHWWYIGCDRWTQLPRGSPFLSITNFRVWGQDIGVFCESWGAAVETAELMTQNSSFVGNSNTGVVFRLSDKASIVISTHQKALLHLVSLSLCLLYDFETVTRHFISSDTTFCLYLNGTQ